MNFNLKYLGLLSFLFLVFEYNSQSLQLDWCKQISGDRNDAASAISVDASGNVYLGGVFEDTVDFDPSVNVLNLISNGNKDFFISKFDESGVHIWTKNFGSNLEDWIKEIKLDSLGNIVVTGYFSSTVDFDPSENVFNLVSQAGFDAYVMKLDSNGNFLWAVALPGTSDQLAHALEIDCQNNIVITGEFYGVADFDPSLNTSQLTSQGNQDIFILKLNGNGEFVWVKQIGEYYFDRVSTITVDKYNNVIITGSFRTTIDMNPGSEVYNLTSGGIDDVFILKLDQNGDFVWVKQFVGPGADYAFAVDVDSDCNIYSAGLTSINVDFDPGPLTNIQASSGGYISKLDANGNFVWVKNFATSGGSIYFKEIFVDNLGDVYSSGNFNFTFDFDPSSITLNKSSLGGDDIFMHKLDSAGNFKWIHTFGSSSGDVSYCVFVDPSKNVYSAGFFNSTMDADPSTEIFSMQSVGMIDCYFNKIIQCSTQNTSIINESACNSYNAPDNQIYTQTGTYTAIIPNFQGCDSIITINLTVNNPTSSSITETVCGSYTAPDNQVYTQSGTYTAVIPNSSACDSTITINLTVNNPTNSSITEIVCGSYTAPDNQIYTQSGTYLAIISNADGCDSTITINLTVNNVVSTVTNQSPTLISTLQNASYQWIDCSNGNEVIQGETNQSFTASQNGEYAVIVTQNSCSDTSECILVSNVGLNEFKDNVISIFPNPTSALIEVNLAKIYPNISFKVITLSGQIIETKNLVNTNTCKLDLSSFANGMYYLELNLDGKTQVLKLVKE